LVAFACSLADIAAEVTLQYFKQLQNVDNKLHDGQFDPVTIADRDAETNMRAAIEKNYGTENLTWVLDPIDGTRAFISGIPVWGTLIALFDGRQPLLGVMDQPFTGERFVGSGERSICLHKNTEKVLTTRDCRTLANAVMSSTAPDMFNSSEFQVQQQLAEQVKLMRYGADCYAYCMLASGHMDLVVEADLAAATPALHAQALTLLAPAAS